MRFGSGCGEQTIIFITRNRIALNRISDLLRQRAIDSRYYRTETKISEKEYEHGAIDSLENYGTISPMLIIIALIHLILYFWEGGGVMEIEKR